MITRRHFLYCSSGSACRWPGAALASPPRTMATALVKRHQPSGCSPPWRQRRAEVDRNPALIYGMVDEIVVAPLRFREITQGAVGQYWREATPAQQQALTNGFKQVLIRTYASARC